MTAPHGPSQQECIKASFREANIHPDELRIAEMHGTGTFLGDPIEFGALRFVLRSRNQPITKTTGKSNYGHLEATAGVAGLTKCVMMLTHGVCLPNCNLKQLNRNIDPSNYSVNIASELIALGNSGYAGVSSFGFGGTNARGDLWARALSGPFTSGGDWNYMDKLGYIKGRQQDFIDRANALEEPDFSDAFKKKIHASIRASYCRDEAKDVGRDWRLTLTDWMGRPLRQAEDLLRIGPLGT
jgi:hypothetical protein